MKSTVYGLAGSKFLLGLLLCLFILTGVADAVEFETGLSLVSLSESEEYKSETTVSPTIALLMALNDKSWFKLELGGLRYSVTKPGEKRLSPGGIDISGFSLAGIFVFELEGANVYFGGGVAGYKYDSGTSSEITSLLAEMGYTYKEEIDPALGRQLIFGISARINENLTVGVDYRTITVKPDYTGTFYYFSSGKPYLSVSDEVDFSHTWLGVNVAYTFR